MMFDGMEGDDVIGYICSNLYPDSEKVIYSSDRDFIQLIDDKITIWNPIKGILKMKMGRTRIWNVSKLFDLRAMDGDKSDDIDGVKVGLNSSKNYLFCLKEIVNIEDVLKYSDEHKSSERFRKHI